MAQCEDKESRIFLNTKDSKIEPPSFLKVGLSFFFVEKSHILMYNDQMIGYTARSDKRLYTSKTQTIHKVGTSKEEELDLSLSQKKSLNEIVF